jgi:DnaJ-class molecular chaperone
VVWNKRGNTGGGASSGRDGTKRGGKDYTPEISVDQGTMTCPRCSGSGEVRRPHVETDEDGGFTGSDQMDCPRCGGSGTVKK